MPDLKKMLTLEALSEALPSWLKRSTKPEYNADEIDSTLTTNQFVSASDKDNWNAKGTYSKPSGGIPKSDLSSIVQTSLEKADSALQSETDPTVPTWAKQSNKPSYTQDEVADGSTYKRVTQNEKDAWSGKQNALTTTQMQAVNSGITAEGVAQISTNHSDILTLEKRNGIINLLNFNNANMSQARSVTYDIKADGSVIVNGKPTAGGPSYIILYLGNDEVHADEYCDGNHVLYGCPSGGSESTYCMYVSRSSYVKYDTGSGVILDSTALSGILVVIRIADGYTANNLVFKPAIIDKALWDSGFTTPIVKTLPNFTLTPALIEQVDSGAKNLFNPVNVSSTSYGTWDVSTGTFTQTGTDTKANLNLTLKARTSSSASWIEIFVNRDIATNGVMSIPFACPVNATEFRLGHNGSAQDTLMAMTGFNIKAGAQCVVQLNVLNAVQASGKYSWKDIMICTKAAFDVSPKFVPHCKSNYELTQYTDGCSLDTMAKSSGSLDDITTNAFAVYNASVTGKPVDSAGSTSAFTALCKTDVYNSSEAMQTLTRLSNGHRWVRTKTAGAWNPWVEITTLKMPLNVSASESGQLELINLTAYKSNDQVTVSVKCTVKTALQANTIGRQLLNVFGAVTVSGSCMLNAVYGINVLPCWATGQGIWIRHNIDIPANSEIYISGIYPCQ